MDIHKQVLSTPVIFTWWYSRRVSQNPRVYCTGTYHIELHQPVYSIASVKDFFSAYVPKKTSICTTRNLGTRNITPVLDIFLYHKFEFLADTIARSDLGISFDYLKAFRWSYYWAKQSVMRIVLATYHTLFLLTSQTTDQKCTASAS